MSDRFRPAAALCALLLGLSCATARADEIQDANKLFKQGQYALALNKVDGVLSHRPKDAQARFLKGLIKTEQGQTDEAIQIFTGLTVDYPELPEPYNNLAVLYASREQYDKAKTELELAIRTHPSYATAHENLGDIYAKMASMAYNRALQLDSSNTTSQTKLALIKDLFSNTKTSKPGPTVVASAQPVAMPAAAQATATQAAAVPAAPVTTAQPATSTPPATASSTPAVTTAPLQPAAQVATSELPASQPPAAMADDVLKTVQEWAVAWSSNNVPKYLAFYAKSFKVPGGESRSNWEQQRRDRIAKPKSIHVGIEGAKVHVSDTTHAAVTFRQFYRSGTLKTTTLKTLEMVKLDNKWQIVEERTGR